MAQLINNQPDVPDYNKMFNAPGSNGPTTYNQPQPLQQTPQPMSNTNSTQQADVGPLGFPHQVVPNAMPAPGTSVTTTTTTYETYAANNNNINNNTNAPINMAPFTAPAGAAAMTQRNNHHGNDHRRRSSIGDFFSNMIGGDSASKSGSSKHLSANSDGLGRRRSSAYLDVGDSSGNEHKGPYADISRAQAQHMERVREAEKNLHLTHNIDGIPLPGTQAALGAAPPQQRRRSSVAHILGLDKPLLAR